MNQTLRKKMKISLQMVQKKYINQAMRKKMKRSLQMISIKYLLATLSQMTDMSHTSRQTVR